MFYRYVVNWVATLSHSLHMYAMVTYCLGGKGIVSSRHILMLTCYLGGKGIALSCYIPMCPRYLSSDSVIWLFHRRLPQQERPQRRFLSLSHHRSPSSPSLPSYSHHILKQDNSRRTGIRRCLVRATCHRNVPTQMVNRSPKLKTELDTKR